jgi:CHASE2 domain-containing sensor protein
MNIQHTRTIRRPIASGEWCLVGAVSVLIAIVVCTAPTDSAPVAVGIVATCFLLVGWAFSLHAITVPDYAAELEALRCRLAVVTEERDNLLALHRARQRGYVEESGQEAHDAALGG